MSTPDDIAALRAELAQLRSETERLRKQLTEVRSFINVEYDDDDRPTNICINRCAVISFSRPDAAGRMQMMLAAGPGDSGPCFAMYDSSEKPRVVLSVENNLPQIILQTSDREHCVLLEADPATGFGLVAALDNGKPRALLKAGEGDAGVVSAVHDDGHPRVVLRSTSRNGEVLVANSSLQTGVKLTTDSLRGGGTLTVTGHSGKVAVVLSTTDGLGGCIILNDPEGIPYITLPDPAKMPDDEL